MLQFSKGHRYKASPFAPWGKTTLTKETDMTLFLIKSFHSFVFIVETVAILFILYSGLFNVGGPWLVVAIILVVAEIIIFVGTGLRCPLTNLAKKLGDKTGDDYIADILFPEWFKPLVSPVCGSLAFIGLIIVGLRLVIR
jgi:hypothetical protein